MNAPADLPPELLVPPHSIESEQSVLGGLMLDNDAIDRMGSLRAEQFYRHSHRLIFTAITTLIAQQKPADVITVHDVLESHGKAEQAGGLTYLTELTANTPSTANIGRYADTVRDRWLRRGLLHTAGRVHDIVTADDGKTAAQMLDAAQGELGKLADHVTHREPVALAEAVSRYADKLDQIANGELKPVRRVSTGLTDLDRILGGGLVRGSLTTIGARPGMGKSALAESIALNAARAGFSVDFLAMEMSEEELTQRAIANLGRVPIAEIMDGAEPLRDYAWPGVTTAIQLAADMQLRFDDQPSLTLLDVVTKARASKRKHGLDLLVIDYLQLMEGSEEKRYQQIETITKGLKALAKTLDIAVLVLSQFSREIERRPNKRPNMADFRDGGSIEQDSDVLAGLYREEQDDPDTEWKNCAELIIIKQRQGKLGTVNLTYIGEFTRFEDYTGPAMAPYAQRAKASRRNKIED